MKVRAEYLQDLAAIHHVNVAAFGQDNEADLVDRLRGVASTFSFVAVESDSRSVSAKRRRCQRVAFACA